MLEWVADWYGAYPPGEAVDPTGPPEGSARVVRGGSWSGDLARARVAGRGGYVRGFRSHDLGFRLASSSL